MALAAYRVSVARFKWITLGVFIAYKSYYLLHYRSMVAKIYHGSAPALFEINFNYAIGFL